MSGSNGDGPVAPPQNLEAERSALGAVLLGDTALPTLVGERLLPGDFYREAHGLVFAAMLELHNAGEPVDALTLVEHLKQAGKLEAAGGRAAIDLLAGAVPAVGNVPQYVRIVRENAMLRRLLSASYEIQARVASNGVPARKQAELAEREVRSIAASYAAAASLVTRASDVQSRSIRWAWTGRLALGYLTVQTGVEGLGKSVFAAWMIARLTRGELDGAFEDEPIDVLVVAGEDGIPDTWKPRLELSWADLRRVHFLNLDDFPPDWNLRDGIEQLRAATGQTGARFVFIDAALDHMPTPKAGESVNSPTFVRCALMPLKRLVRELDLVGLFSMHPPKGKGSDFRDLVQASQAFSAIPRIGLLFAYHPDDREQPEQQRRRVLLRGKGNIGRDPGALEFPVVGRQYRHDDGHVSEREVVGDVTPSDVTMADLAADRLGVREPNKTDRAAEYIRDALRGGEWRLCQPIIDALKSQGLGGDSVIKGACRQARVEKEKENAQDGRWRWRIPVDGGEGVPADRRRPDHTGEDSEAALTPSTPARARSTPPMPPSTFSP